MTLELKFNNTHKTLDLIGHIPEGTKNKVTELMTYNPTLQCYQGAINKQVLLLAKELQVKVAPNLIDDIRKFLSVKQTRQENEDPKEISGGQQQEPRIIGFIIKHPAFGLGRLLSIKDGIAKVCFFFPPSQKRLNCNSINRSLISLGSICKTNNGKCTIKEQLVGQGRIPHAYVVEYDNGLVDELPESEVTPVETIKPHNPLDILAILQQDGYSLFKKREELVHAHNSLVSRSLGVKSLLSSRIDLYPHQAYVAGTVILDNKQRYLLADEVGLGKTIEAGIIIHDLLSRNPIANILILCPGTLLQQWLSEMYSKFSGVVFRLPELSGISALTSGKAHNVILSFNAALTYAKELTSHKWDLVVIDEVHNLLYLKSLYELVKNISMQVRSLILLSALPAQRHDQEYYDLLTLLEPRKYKQDDAETRKRFSLVFERQREIGGRIGVVNRRLMECQENELEPNRVIKQLDTLINMPVLKDDQYLKDSLNKINHNNKSFPDDVHQILHHISDYYRINRRILRNRREKLIDSDQLERVKRDYNVLYYLPDQYELNALNSIERLLKSLKTTELREEILLQLTKQLFQAASHPTTLLEILEIGKHIQVSTLPEREYYEELPELVSYAEWYDHIRYLWGCSLFLLDQELLQEAVRTAEAWNRQGTVDNIRLQKLFSFIEDKHRNNPKEKYILFAGYPSLASVLTKHLFAHFGQASIAQFYFGLHKDPAKERDLKEKEAKRFKIDPQTWLLVCDETGGEGRNFQFAAELIHYDLPWQVAKMEQRIGRLDRLGRKRLDVISNILIAKGSKEDAWLNCLSNGLDIFNRSISGLEFALRDVEMEATLNLLSDDDQLLWDMPLNIKLRVKDERARDESQHQMDEASYERIRANDFRRAQSNPAQDRDLEIAFINYFKAISDKDSVKFPWQVDYPEGVIEFHPEDVRNIKLALADDNQVRTGTFRREIAQQRPDLEFFSIGNDFFDSICESLFINPSGRTYAIECKAEQTIWRGFEFIYRARQAKQLADEKNGYVNFLEHLFNEHIEHCFVDENEKIKELPGDILRMRRLFNKQNKRKVWKNLIEEKSTLLTSYYPNWELLLRKNESIARTYAHERFVKILSPKIEEQVTNIDEQIKNLKNAMPDNWEDQIKALNKLKEFLPMWELELVATGFLSINGGILGD